MIRILCIGPSAPAVSERLLADAPAVDVAAERLPAGAVRSFQRQPADVLVYCWPAPDARMSKVIDVLRTTPLGELTPSVAVTTGDGDEDLEVDAVFGADAPATNILQHVGELLGIDAAEFAAVEQPGVEQPREEQPPAEQTPPDQTVDRAPRTESTAPPSSAGESLEPSTIEAKLRQVRHESYFAILEVATDATAAVIRDAYELLSTRFGRTVPRDLTQRYGAELDEVREALDDAFAVLSNDELRATYADGESR